MAAKGLPNAWILISSKIVILMIIGTTTANNTNDCMTCPPLPKLDVLPGRGWDNLRNKDMNQVFEFTYCQCKTTPDNLYLIPDNTYITPVKESDIHIFSEIIQNWKKYSSMTARSINVNVEVSLLGLFQVGTGSFSEEYQHIKEQQVDQKSVTTRVQARYVLYTVGTPTTMKLDDNLRSILQTTIEAIKSNNTMMVNYNMELIVRDYGTHVLTRMDAGALINQDDFISQVFSKQYESNSEVIKAAASAKFFLSIFQFSAGANISYSVSTAITNEYMKNLRSSSIKSFGGKLLKPQVVGNETVNSWVESIPKNLAAIDREGEPLHFIITPSQFPNESLLTVNKLQDQLLKAIVRYYNYNKHVGCMTVGSPNFDYYANVEGACTDPTNKYSFGGVFQTCVNSKTDLGDYCVAHKHIQKNILTEDFSCLEPYRAFPLKSNVDQSCQNRCNGWWLWRDCWDECSYANYTTYWCAAVNVTIKPNSGFMFGGIYSPSMENPLTQTKDCPPTFTSVLVLEDLHICVGNDYELGARFSAKFGGFFSCENGNPLYTADENLKKGLLWSTHQNIDYPKACPAGHTQHTAIIYKDCLISYCVKAGSFELHGPMPVALPPFMNYTGRFFQNNQNQQQVPQASSGSSPLVLILIVGLAITILGLFVSIGVIIRGRRSLRAQDELRQPILDDASSPMGNVGPSD